MTHIEALKAEVRELEERIKAAKRELAKLSAEFSESNDELGQMHLSIRSRQIADLSARAG